MRIFSRINRLAAILVLGLIVAGGVAVQAGTKRPTGPVVAHRAGGEKLGSSSVRVENIKVWDHAAEPTIGINPQGEVFYVAADLNGDPVARNIGIPNQVHVFKSDNDGGSWAEVSPRVGPVRRHAVTLDPYIFVDEVAGQKNARIFNIDLTVACSYLSFSDDDGATWTTNPLACGRPVNDHQTLFAGPAVTSSPSGYPHIVYYCWNDVATSSCTKSLDGGITFRPTGSPAFFPGDGTEGQGNPQACGGLHGHGVVGRDGTVLIPKEHCGRPFLALSEDEGSTWTRVQVSQLEVTGGISDPSVAVDDKGNIYYLFTANKDRLPYLVYSRNKGKTWSKPVMVGVPGLKEANLATLDAGDPGKVAIAYMGSTNVKVIPSGGKEPRRDHAAATWNAYVAASTDVFAQDPVFVTGQVNRSSDPIKRRACGPGRCGRVFDFIDVVIAPNGTPWGAFVDACVAECELTGAAPDQGDEAFVGRLIGLPRLR